jgi:hypothetical protein
MAKSLPCFAAQVAFRVDRDTFANNLAVTVGRRCKYGVRHCVIAISYDEGDSEVGVVALVT